MSNNKQLKGLCNDIVGKSDKVRYAGIISPYGKTLAGSIRKGIKPLFKPEEAMNEFFLTAIREMLRKPFEDSLGKHIASITLHEKVYAISLASDKHILYITFEPNTSFDEMLRVARDAKEMLEKVIS